MATPNWVSVPEVPYAEVLEHYGSRPAIGRAFDVSRATVMQWARAGKLPPLRALQFADLRKARKTKRSPKLAPSPCAESVTA